VGIAVLVINGAHVLSAAAMPGVCLSAMSGVVVSARAGVPVSAMARVTAMAMSASGTTFATTFRTSFVLMQQAAVHFVTASTAGNCQHRNEGPNDVFHGR
jgi:hypothetical protein